MQLRVLSWNIQAGGGSRLTGIVKAIRDSKAAIVVLSEFRNNEAGMTIRGKLLKLGYRYQAVTHAEPNANSVIIVSTLPFDSQLHPASDEEYSGNMVTAHFPAFSLIGVYLPHKKKHRLFEHITDIVADSDQPYIIAGDFNSGKNYIDQVGNSFHYTAQLAALEREGVADAFRHVYADIKEYSWYSHQGNGFRYDHTYLTASLLPAVKDCYYIHEWRTSKLSDHSAMMLVMG